MSELSEKSRHLIQFVSKRTGISPDVIRVWERRYSAIVSKRSNTNRRLYSDEDIEKLNLLKRAIKSGRRIGDIANLSYSDLFELVVGDESNSANSYSKPTTGMVMELFDEAITGINEMDSQKIDNALANALTVLSITDFFTEFLKPLHNHINDECKRGSIRYIQEKLAKISIRTCLSGLYTNSRTSKKQSPGLVVASLIGENENIDTLMHIIIAQNIGWNVTYVGSGIPSDELTYMAEKISAQVMVLALNNPRDISRKSYEIKTIRDNADRHENIVLIGNQALEYRNLVDDVKASISPDIGSFRLALERFYSLIR